MRESLHDVQFTPASDAMQRGGLLGWVACTLRGLRLDGIAVRCTAAGRTAVFYPERPDSTGRPHKIVWPIDPEDRDSLSRSLLAVLRARGDLR
jgi:hypothetical protein